MLQNTWIHNIDPFLIQFSGNIGVRWYGLAYVCGFMCAYLFMRWLSRKKITPLSEEQISDFISYGILGVLVGGRLGYALFYSPDLITDFRSSVPFWGVLAVWEGGMASHGGFLGVLAACYFFAKKHKLDFFHVGDLTIFGATFGILFGRIANFINGELMGRVSSPDFTFAVKFPQDVFRWIGYEKQKLPSLEPVAQAMGIDSQKWQGWMDNIPGQKASLYDFTHKMILQVQSGNIEVLQALQGVLEPRHPSQLYAACTEALIPFLILFFLWKQARKPGLICSLYFILYPLGRIFNEFFRLPDAHLADLSQQPLGLTRGQFLSLFIFAIGAFCLVWTQKRDVPKVRGWGES